MSKYFLLAAATIIFSCFTAEKASIIKADRLLKELNRARSNPQKYGNKIGISLQHKSTFNLVKDDHLMEIAQKKALYMAENDELTHYVNGKPTVNEVIYDSPAESCSMSNNTDDHIKNLIIDSPGERGHRYQLLGYKEYSKNNVVGIGMAMNEHGRVYCCIITAVKK